MARHYGKARIKRQKLARRIRFYITLFAVLTALLALTFVTVKTSFFKVKGYSFSPEEYKEDIMSFLKPELVDSRMGSILGLDNYFVWKNKTYSNAQFSKIKVDKNLLKKRINVFATLREKHLIWCFEEDIEILDYTCYWADKDGVLAGSAPFSTGQLLGTVIQDKQTKAILLNNKVTDEVSFERIESILQYASRENLSLKEARLIIDKQEFHLLTNNNSKIFFSLRFDPNISAISAAEEILQKVKASKLNYLDLTVENRAFYKLK